MVNSLEKAPSPIVVNSCLLHVYLYIQAHSCCCSYWQQLPGVLVNKHFAKQKNINLSEPCHKPKSNTTLTSTLFGVDTKITFHTPPPHHLSLTTTKHNVISYTN